MSICDISCWVQQWLDDFILLNLSFFRGLSFLHFHELIEYMFLSLLYESLYFPCEDFFYILTKRLEHRGDKFSQRSEHSDHFFFEVEKIPAHYFTSIWYKTEMNLIKCSLLWFFFLLWKKNWKNCITDLFFKFIAWTGLLGQNIIKRSPWDCALFHMYLM